MRIRVPPGLLVQPLTLVLLQPLVQRWHYSLDQGRHAHGYVHQAHVALGQAEESDAEGALAWDGDRHIDLQFRVTVTRHRGQSMGEGKRKKGCMQGMLSAMVCVDHMKTHAI